MHVKRINPLGNRSTSVYDSAGRPIASVDPLLNRTTTVYNAAAQTKASIDALGNRTSYTYDDAGEEIAVTNARGNISTTIYDAARQTTALIDARGNRNSFSYDAAGRKTALIDPLNRRTTSSYDAAGRQTLRIDARGNRTTYTFDADDQQTGRKYPDGSRATFTYNSVGNRTSMADSTGQYTSTYNSLNRIESVVNPANKKITYAYDAVGQQDHIRDPDGGRFTYSYDAASRLGNLINPQGDRTSYTYDAADRRTLKKLANGTRASFTYDAANNLTKLYNLKSDSSVISGFDYKYDNVSNRTSVVEANGDRVTWSYDTTYQLNREQRSGANAYDTKNTYDAAGNRLFKDADSVLTTTVYDAANQIQHSEAAAGRTTYTFDANGNQQVVQKPSGDRTTNTWDFENKNTKVALPANVLNTNTYNADSLRVQIENSEGTSKIIWDGQQYLAETDSADNTTVMYTNSPDRFTNLISQKETAKTSWFHYDALGSTRQATDSIEAVSDTFLYDAWGNEIVRTGSTRIVFRFVGQYGYFYNLDTGDISVMERIYEPENARWTSVDPAGFVDALLRYMYGQNNPMVFVDPSGLVSFIGTLPPVEAEKPGPSKPKGNLCKRCCPLDKGKKLPKNCDNFKPIKKKDGCEYNHDICFAILDSKGVVVAWPISCVCDAIPDSPVSNCMRGCLQCIFDNNGGITPGVDLHSECVDACCKDSGIPLLCKGLIGIMVAKAISKCVPAYNPGIPKDSKFPIPPTPVDCVDGKLVNL